MAFSKEAGRTALHKGGNRYTCLWHVVTLAAEHYRYTNHSQPLRFSLGTGGTLEHDSVDPFLGEQLFTPAGYMDATARRNAAALRMGSLEFKGFLSSSDFTEENLRKGYWEGATVREYIVDWLYPWLGSFRTHKYLLDQTKFNGVEWEASLLTAANSELSKKHGKVYAHTCWHALGDSLCGVDMAVLNTTYFTGTVAVTPTGDDVRVKFRAAPGGGSAAIDTVENEYFRWGKLVWTTGTNKGVTSLIGNSQNAATAPSGDAEISLFSKTPEVIESGDAFTLYVGCDKNINTCKDRFSNFTNYGGFPWIPSTRGVVSIPQHV